MDFADSDDEVYGGRVRTRKDVEAEREDEKGTGEVIQTSLIMFCRPSGRGSDITSFERVKKLQEASIWTQWLNEGEMTPEERAAF